MLGEFSLIKLSTLGGYHLTKHNYQRLTPLAQCRHACQYERLFDQGTIKQVGNSSNK